MATDDKTEATFQPVFENRVRFAETDLQGIVFYGEYFTFQDEAISAYLRELEYGYEEMVDDGWQIHVVNAELNYRDGAQFGDRLMNEARVVEVGNSSITFEYRVRRVGRDEGRRERAELELESEERGESDGTDRDELDESDTDGPDGGDANETGEPILAEGTVTHVGVDLETEEPIRIPDAFRDAVVALQGGI
ncbi:thioesterase domain protein [Natrialba magadii ATCC 43099]|uniref:Thioesterase domain protein n=1 Tax=Natrialba magadii (strain ATCC 43099 / DSM 3394 / CCM 3739 / CIP 104546 / IAM 13178 / JCM 8861 / NBRC 102185 / NCIMB 2190 / MS3) TaxID=547559 RepID=D3SYG5_NATMM|nr:thioesterase family protein [Natrialba magadii]ADD06136.1 thioesterase domain protein [Natrialba magadii ATCC 43099]ELY30865.1 thioesterase superfamily protein [Natrialba magadii ATCC 43099]